MNKKIKQCIIIRKDLKMRRGKEIAQGSHASSAFMISQGKNIVLDEIDLEWIKTGHTKITFKVDSEDELIKLYNKALSLGLKTHLITDWGLTEFNGVLTKTAIAIGPNYSDEINIVTEHLQLY